MDKGLTVIVKSRGIDVDYRPSRDVEYSCIARMVPNNESIIHGTVLQNCG